MFKICNSGYFMQFEQENQLNLKKTADGFDGQIAFLYVCMVCIEKDMRKVVQIIHIDIDT